MADIRIINEWLEKADDDFHFAAANLREGSEFFAQICFHFQQSAEKYLKAYIIAHDLAFSKVHDLVYLLKICSDNMPELGLLKEDCILLNAAYIDTRYPVHWPTDYTRETALKLYTSADNIAQTIREKLDLKLVGGQ
jgi:HEPN domain-containing protein